MPKEYNVLTLLNASVAFTVDRPRETDVERDESPGPDASVDIIFEKRKFKDETPGDVITVERPLEIIVDNVLIAGTVINVDKPIETVVDKDDTQGP